MAGTPEAVIYIIYPLCTLGVAGTVALGVSKVGDLEKKIDRLCRRFGDHQVKVEHRLSSLESKCND